MVPQKEVEYVEEAPLPKNVIVPVESSSKGAMLIKILKILGISIPTLFLVAVFLYKAPFLLGFVTSDIPEVDDSRLIPGDTPVPNEDNAYFLLEEVSRAFNDAEGVLEISPVATYLRGEEGLTKEKIGEYLEVYKKPLEIFLSMDEKNYFKNPNVFYANSYNPFEEDPLSLSSLRSGTYLAILKSEYELQNNNEEEALRYILKPLSISKKLSEPNVVLSNVIVGIAMKGIVYDFLSKAIDEYQLSTTTKRKLISALHNIDDKVLDSQISAFQFEYLTSKFFITSLEESIKAGKSDKELSEKMQSHVVPVDGMSISNFYYFRPNETIKLYSDLFLAIIKDLENGCPYKSSGIDQEMVMKGKSIMGDGGITDVVRLWFTENAIGRILFSVNAVTVHGLSERQCERAQTQANIIQKLEESLI